MRAKNKISPTRRTLYWIMLLAVFTSAFATGNLLSVHAQAMVNGTLVQISAHVLSNGQFVYGPNVGNFNLKIYLQDNAPHLAKNADGLYGRSEYFSINPKIYLTLLEVHGNLISSPNAARLENPFNLPDMDFISQIEYISEIMSDAYYLHLYSYSSLPASQRKLPSLVIERGDVIKVAPETNAATYAIIAVLSKTESQQSIPQILDTSQSNGFYQTYIKLFGNDDPLDETNHIFIPGESGASSTSKDSLHFNLASEVSALSAPSDLLQLPYLSGLSWFFGGVHSNGAGGVQSPYTDASALDFGPGGIAWGGDTSNMWVVASASGIPTKISACYFSVLHSDGWETTYYHLENIQNFSGSINQNDKIGVIANTLAEATCSGGSATGPHVHFNLKRNGALVAINGTPLSGWYVHAGRWNYDTDPNYMWLERGGVKKYANTNRVLSEAPPIPPTVISSVRANADSTGATNVDFTVTFSQSVTGVDTGDFTLTTSGVSGPSVSGVSVSGSVYTVTVNTGSGSGTIKLNVMDNDSILSGSAIPLGGVGAGNGNYTSGETYTITKTWIFGDVPASYWANSFIESLYNAGITSGCSVSPLNYCPEATVTRAQMAIFLLKGIHGSGYTPPAVGAGTGFGDVSVGYWAAAWIKQLAVEGITSGCGGGNYCPEATVTRAQMAIFLLKAEHGSGYLPPSATGVFGDVPPGSFADAWIEQLAAEGITSGCGGGNYCPNGAVTRAQMAVFLVRTFNLL